MRVKIFLFAITTFIVATSENSCRDKETRISQIPESHADSLWINFLNAMERNDIDYLQKNSLDSIICADCKLAKGNYNEIYESNFVFRHHLDKLMHLKDFKNREFQTAEDEKQLQVIYSVKSKYAEQGAYSLIFLFDKTNKDYLFKGMIMT